MDNEYYNNNVIELFNCSPDCMYIIMYFWPYGLWPSGLNKLSCLVMFYIHIVRLVVLNIRHLAEYY